VAGNFNRFIRPRLNVKPATTSRNHRKIASPASMREQNRERERAGVGDAKKMNMDGQDEQD
jgi:hypothetical protein